MKLHRILWVVLTLRACASIERRVGAGSRGDAAGGRPARHVSVEGITEYPLPNGLRVLLFPIRRKRRLRSTSPIWSAPSRELRGDGHGASAGAPALQGFDEHPTSRRSCMTTARARMAARATSAPTTSRRFGDGRQPGMGDRSRSGSHGERVRSRKDLDSEMTVVRNEFELARNRR